MSPALRWRRLCFFHNRVRLERARNAQDASAKGRFELPLLEDANSVQVSLMKVMQMLTSGHLDHKTAGLLLYALQTASSNLRRTNFEPQNPTDVVIDRNTIDCTCIAGPQWFHREFEEPPDLHENDLQESDLEKDDLQENDPEKINPEKVAAAKAGEKTVAAGRPTRLRSKKRKKPDPAETESSEQAEIHDFFRTLIPGYDAAKAKAARENGTGEQHRC